MVKKKAAASTTTPPHSAAPSEPPQPRQIALRRRAQQARAPTQVIGQSRVAADGRARGPPGAPRGAEARAGGRGGVGTDRGGAPRRTRNAVRRRLAARRPGAHGWGGKHSDPGAYPAAIGSTASAASTAGKTPP